MVGLSVSITLFIILVYIIDKIGFALHHLAESYTSQEPINIK